MTAKLMVLSTVLFFGAINPGHAAQYENCTGTCQHRDATPALVNGKDFRLQRDGNVLRPIRSSGGVGAISLAYDVQPNIERCIETNFKFRIEKHANDVVLISDEVVTSANCIHAWMSKSEPVSFQALDSSGRPIGSPFSIRFKAMGKDSPTRTANPNQRLQVPFDDVTALRFVTRTIDVILDD
jgi:hypothetical protein